MRICFIDFETTGSNAFKDYPIQIGAILVNDRVEIENEFFSDIYIDSNIEISQEAYNIHGIDFEKLRHAPIRSQVLSNYFKLIGTDYCFAGWNISFDVTFMRKLCHEEGYMTNYDAINYRHIDLQSIIYYLRQTGKIPNNIYSLSDMTNYLGISRFEKHNALEDAKLAYTVYKYIFYNYR